MEKKVLHVKKSYIVNIFHYTFMATVWLGLFIIRVVNQVDLLTWLFLLTFLLIAISSGLAIVQALKLSRSAIVLDDNGIFFYGCGLHAEGKKEVSIANHQSIDLAWKDIDHIDGYCIYTNEGVVYSEVRPKHRTSSFDKAAWAEIKRYLETYKANKK